MSDIALTTAQVAPVFTKFGKAEIYDMVASEAITIGNAVAIVSATGLVAPADASTGGGSLIQFVGVALTAAAAGQAVSVLHHGCIYGYTLTDYNYGAKIWLSNTAGVFCGTDEADTTVECGIVWPLTDADVTKVLFVDVDIGDAAHT